jgi:hypothetical protein
MYERHFDAYGVRIGLRVDCRGVLDTLGQDAERGHLPFGWHAVDDHPDDTPVSVRYQLLTSASHGVQASFRVKVGEHLLADVRSVTEATVALAAHAEPWVAARAPNHLFVHAGVVGWQGRAVLMPGTSFAGKTTLVQAWLEAGATYYSDEFAVLDGAGRVHPFARPLSVRAGPTALPRQMAAAALGARTGTTPLPIGLVLVTSYSAGARWRPRRLTTARTLIELMRHAIAARGSPAHSMPILSRAASESLAFTSRRGEARPMVAAVLAHVATPTSPTADDPE